MLEKLLDAPCVADRCRWYLNTETLISKITYKKQEEDDRVCNPSDAQVYSQNNTNEENDAAAAADTDKNALDRCDEDVTQAAKTDTLRGGMAFLK